MTTASNVEPRGRRAWRAPALVAGACLLALLGMVLFWGIRAAGALSAGYAAKVLCSCVFVARREPEACRREELGDYGYVDTRLDRAARLVETRSLLLGHARAEYLGPLGCTLQ